jgi:hypothetical protein
VGVGGGETPLRFHSAQIWCGGGCRLAVVFSDVIMGRDKDHYPRRALGFQRTLIQYTASPQHYRSQPWMLFWITCTQCTERPQCFKPVT